jgi:two-component system chemotaxis sensor kinase CheA
VFRDFHTLKGSAATMGLDKLVRLAHSVEDLLDALVQAKTAPSPAVLQAVLESLDCVRALIDEFRDGRDRAIDPAPVLARLRAAASGESLPSAAAAAPAADEDAPRPDAAAPEAKTQNLPTVRVALKKLDSIMNMVEELTVVKARLFAHATSLKSDALAEEIKSFEQLIKQLQQETLETRLISVSGIFQGYRRVVRDTAQSLGKEVDFVVEDNGISIDRVLLDKINEPLVHILRNAVDHGLEDGQTRRGAGKPATGTVTLRARRDQGFAVVEVQDDGGGMDAARVKRKAVELGLITKAEAEAMSDEVAHYLVCRPNFSTRDEVTELSGRGVGMDVVQKVLDSVNGRLEIESKPGAGTRIALHLPLNLAIIQALMLRSGGQAFAAPLSDVLEIFSFDAVEISAIENEPVIHLRGEIIPVRALADKFGLPRPEKPGEFGVIVRTIRGKLALRVEALLGRSEIVVKNFEGYLKNIDGINSATILGDGSVVLILDLRGLQ